MQCFVYKGTRKQGAYLYLLREDNFSDLPEQLLSSMGKLELALRFELTEERKLAQADAQVVRENLLSQGYHLQMPPPAHNLLAQLPNAKPPE